LNRRVRFAVSFAAAWCVALGAACANPQPGNPPPVTGTAVPALYWPIAAAVDPTGQFLYVASSNFDLAFTSGWVSQLSTSLFDQVSDGSVVPINASFAHSQLLDSFAGTMLLTSDVPCTTSVSVPCFQTAAGTGTRVYITTREQQLLSTAPVNSATGQLVCAPSSSVSNVGGAGCSFNAVQLGKITTSVNTPGGTCAHDTDCPTNATCSHSKCISTMFMTNPFAMTFTPFILPGATTASDVLLVTHLAPSPTGQPGIGRDAAVAILPVPGPTAALTAPTSDDPFTSVSATVDIGNQGANAVAVSPTTGITYVGGCFVRVQGELVVPCLADSSIPQFHENPVRFFYGGSGFNAEVQTSDLGALVNGGQTEDMAISSDGTLLYVATTMPNALMIIKAPVPGGESIPTLQGVVILANVPNRILVLPRPGQGDLVLVTAADPNVVLAETSAFLVVDPQAATVVADIEPVGSTPYGMAVMKTGTGWRVFVTLFGACGVAAIDIPAEAPEQARHVSTVGSCP
jgi:DNA-binding beta-propeller fold protein YncE